MPGFEGSAVHDDNFRLRFFVIVFMGVLALGSVLYWRTQLLLASDYVDIPTANHQVKHKIINNNYDIDNLPN